jgi:hypothetical protein
MYIPTIAYLLLMNNKSLFGWCSNDFSKIHSTDIFSRQLKKSFISKYIEKKINKMKNKNQSFFFNKINNLMPIYSGKLPLLFNPDNELYNGSLNHTTNIISNLYRVLFVCDNKNNTNNKEMYNLYDDDIMYMVSVIYNL